MDKENLLKLLSECKNLDNDIVGLKGYHVCLLVNAILEQQEKLDKLAKDIERKVM